MQAMQDAENVMGVTLFALGRGARGMAIDLDAVELVRDRFAPKIRRAVDRPKWRKRWNRERGYLIGNAEALGRCAARLAHDDRRPIITRGDVELAMMKLRGRIPVAGRWCPF
jgi:hypothetical protein